jgi:hypothetical protein
VDDIDVTLTFLIEVPPSCSQQWLLQTSTTGSLLPSAEAQPEKAG